jgi:hypothetical protein
MKQNVTKLAPRKDRITFAKLKISEDDQSYLGFDKKHRVKAREAEKILLNKDTLINYNSSSSSSSHSEDSDKSSDSDKKNLSSKDLENQLITQAQM